MSKYKLRFLRCETRFITLLAHFVVRFVKKYYKMKGKKYIYAHKFEGMPKLTDLQLVEEELPPVKDGGRLQGFQNIFAYGCPDRGREFDKK